VLISFLFQRSQTLLYVGLVIASFLFEGTMVCAKDIKRINPPESNFFTKEVECFGIPIKSSDVVSDEALDLAKQHLSLMLQNNPGMVNNLRQSGSELHLIGKDQATSDLPEHRSKKGKPFDGSMDIDKRTRGVGGLCASCGEENLLGLPQDRYADRHSPGSICVHEFAHTILTYGLDESIRQQWQEIYKRSTSSGLWKSAYASKNYDEYFAELSMWYFGGLGDRGHISPTPKAGKEWLQSYDPEAFQLLNRIYTGQLRPKILPPLVVAERHPGSDESSLRSLIGDAPTQLKLVNKTAESVDIFWLDYEGKRVQYGTLEPGCVQIQNTYASHPWLFADKQGNAIAIFVASKEQSVATLR
jgi:VHL beta domain